MSNKLFLIGINKYLNQKSLKSCVKDVLDFKNILLEKYDFSENNVYELLDSKATNKNIQDALIGYSKTTSFNDNLIIFFSGHGDYDQKSDRGFWIPVDGTVHFTSWISNDTITTFLSQMPCKHIFLICDSCFSNSLLNTANTKSSIDYLRYPSRWALTSAFEEAKDSDETSNTLFAETIIRYLEDSENDIRVSELIEEVKRVFLDNLFQQPQGSPMMVKGHKGGEFVFTTKQDFDRRTLKGYIDFKKTLQLYKRNSQFTEVSSFEDKTKKIGYQLFQDVDTVIKKATYYLCLYEGINQTQTLKYLQENAPQIFKEKNLLIFIPKEKNAQNPEIKKRNISDKFKPINLFYIDDFIREQCTPKIINEEASKFLSISNFVLPIFNNGQENESINKYLIDWFERYNEPLLIVKGTGGIGKTTFSQYVADKAQNKFPNITVLFIDSVLIKDTLLKSKHNGEFKIYNFYEALFDITDSISEKLNEDIFKVNVDAGNILLIIDGLDEVISKIPNFDIKQFLKSIEDSSNALGGGKVIITCRTHFWNSSELPDKIFAEIELEPFNKSQANQFFEKSFNSDESKIRKALKLADEFRYPKSDKPNIYDPYVLDIIRSLIISAQESIETDLSEFSSKLLNNNIKNDYIIYRVCDRERKRIGQISVDEQVKFFVYLAMEKRGVMPLANLNTEISVCLGKRIDLTNVEALKSHPFLKNEDSTIKFRYDFLADLFRSIYIANYLDYDSSKQDINFYLIDAIAENCWFGSAISQDIINRLNHWNDDDILFISHIVDVISKNGEISLTKKRKAIANIFNLALLSNHKYFGNDVYHNTEIILKLFAKKQKEIEMLCIIDINSDQNIRFDFSGLDINNAFIDNYGLFWECNFDQDTRFIKCHFINLKVKRKNNAISKDNFIDCTYDKEMESSLKKIELTGINRTEQSKAFLNDFFHLFFSNGRLGRQWEDKVIRPRYYGINKYNHDYKETIKSVKQHGILLITEEKDGTKFSIHDKYKEEVVRFIKDGTISNAINAVLMELSK